MKKVFPLLLLLVLAACGPAKSVSYTHYPLAPEGCTVSYSALQSNGQLFIIVTVKSDRLVFGNEPVMMLKNFDGEVLKLSGQNLQTQSETAGVFVNNIMFPVPELSAIAQFPTGRSDIGFFRSGISKVRLTTVPIIHEKSFTQDKIGSYLFRELIKAYGSEENF